MKKSRYLRTLVNPGEWWIDKHSSRVYMIEHVAYPVVTWQSRLEIGTTNLTNWLTTKRKIEEDEYKTIYPHRFRKSFTDDEFVKEIMSDYKCPWNADPIYWTSSITIYMFAFAYEQDALMFKMTHCGE